MAKNNNEAPRSSAFDRDNRFGDSGWGLFSRSYARNEQRRRDALKAAKEKAKSTGSDGSQPVGKGTGGPSAC